MLAQELGTQITALYLIVQNWKHHRYLSMDEWLNTGTSIQGNLLSHKQGPIYNIHNNLVYFKSITFGIFQEHH